MEIDSKQSEDWLFYFPSVYFNGRRPTHLYVSVSLLLFHLGRRPTPPFVVSSGGFVVCAPFVDGVTVVVYLVARERRPPWLDWMY